MGDLPGLDIARLAPWFSSACPGQVSGRLEARLLTGGRSNLTYEITDGIHSWVLRRPPLGHVLSTAHDMAREHRVITALASTTVPVARAYALCEDPSVLGVPFYIMAKVDGVAYRTAEELATIGPERTRIVAERMIDTLAQLHAVDIAAAGLSDLGRPDGFLARQVRRWKKQWDESRSRSVAGIDELYTRLSARPPDGATPAIVHGDYRLDNLLVDGSDDIEAVVDWEMATLADPLTDVGLLIVYQGLHGLSDGAPVSAAPGYPSDVELLDRYAATTGRALDDLAWHIALASFKLAVIAEGIHFRHLHRQTVGDGFEQMGDLVQPLVESGLATLKEHS